MMIDATVAPADPTPHPPIGLPALEARLQHDLLLLELPGKPWVPALQVEGVPVLNVAILGGGMCGLAAAASLRLLGIDAVQVLDRAPAGTEGPWATFARMETLRSPKTLAGPALGLPSLTFRAWFEAQFGASAWDALGKIPRLQWMQYLVWYRRVMAVDVRNGTAVQLIRPRPDGLLALETSGGPVLARHVVLATGRDGLGGSYTPPIAQRLNRTLWAHSRDDIDFAALRGKRVGVVGAGASAMDNAATALEAGAARLDLFVRRAALPAVNKLTGIGSAGLVHGFEALPDAWKWRFLHYSLSEQTPPPRDSTLRVARHAHAHLHLGAAMDDITEQDGRLHVRTKQGAFDLDFLIFATGFRVDLAQRPELALLAPHVRFWRDRFVADPTEPSDELAWSPDLAPDFAFQERVPGACPGLAHVHCFNYPASLSHGRLTGDIPAVSAGAQRLARGIAQSLFVADRAQHYAALQAYDVPELRGDEWERA
jgi:cation diffusion facilitator CzcD-associated flavoprotein CzcO